ncbi:MAG: SAM-dependent methyltransferase [Spirochaetia bacterium]|nr:SAM-dependent methyltransferase [Spirochaetia bacterium]
MTGTLFLVPVPIGPGQPVDELSPRTLGAVRDVRDFVVENVRSARRFLSTVMDQADVDASRFWVIDKDSTAADADAAITALKDGRDTAYLSEAGSPCVADPGALVVAAAHAADARVVPLAGPSAILLALMASGLGGQRFSFEGYLPADETGRSRALLALETASSRDGGTRLCIETPYRTGAFAASAVRVLRHDTWLCAACALSSPAELVVSRRVEDWKARPVDLPREPCVFVLQAARSPDQTVQGRSRRGSGNGPAKSGRRSS